MILERFHCAILGISRSMQHSPPYFYCTRTASATGESNYVTLSFPNIQSRLPVAIQWILLLKILRGRMERRDPQDAGADCVRSPGVHQDFRLMDG